MYKTIMLAVLQWVQILTLVFLVVYVIKTWQMASASRKSIKLSEETLAEMKEARDQESRPNIVAYFDISTDKPGRQLIYLIVENFGKGIARNVKLDFHTPIKGKYGNKLMNTPFIGSGISMMAPGQQIRALLDEFPKYLENKMPLTYDVTISYRGGLRQDDRTDEQTIDLSAFKGLIFAE